MKNDKDKKIRTAMGAKYLTDPPCVDTIEDCANKGCCWNKEGKCSNHGAWRCYGFIEVEK